MALHRPGASGPGKEEAADRLAVHMRAALSNVEGARVSRPVRSTELRLYGLYPATTSGEVLESVAMVGGCSAECVTVGPIRYNSRGVGSV